MRLSYLRATDNNFGIFSRASRRNLNFEIKIDRYFTITNYFIECHRSTQNPSGGIGIFTYFSKKSHFLCFFAFLSTSFWKHFQGSVLFIPSPFRLNPRMVTWSLAWAMRTLRGLGSDETHLPFISSIARAASEVLENLMYAIPWKNVEQI